MRHATTMCTRSDNISTWPGSVLGLGIWGGQRGDHDSSREGLCVGVVYGVLIRMHITLEQNGGLQGVQPHSGCVWPTDSLPIEPPLDGANKLYHQFTSDFVDCIQHSVYDFGVVTDHRCADICIANDSVL